MMGDCARWDISEKRAGLERTLHLCMQIAACGALTLAAGRRARLLPVPWGPVVGLSVTAALFFIASRVLGALIVRADCFLMRNHSITEQPMDFPRTAVRMLREASSFIQR